MLLSIKFKDPYQFYYLAFYLLLQPYYYVLDKSLFYVLQLFSGILHPEWTVKYFSVGIIFFISGISMTLDEILTATTSYRLHAFIQIFTFVCIPVIVFILTSILQFIFNGINSWILKG